MQDLRDLQRTVEDEQAATQRGPLTEASAGWILRDMATPGIPPAGDVHIYASGGRLRARSTLDDVALEEVEIPVGSSVPDPAVAAVSDAPPEYSQAHMQEVVDGVNAALTTVQDMLTSLRAAGLMLP